MKLIQPIFIAATLITFLLIRFKTNFIIRTASRLGIVGFALFFSIFMLFPEIFQNAAEFLRIGRGTDLLLYLSVIAILNLGIIVFLKIGEVENRIEKIVREQALRNYDEEQ